MIEELLKAIAETLQGYIRKLSKQADPDFIFNFLKKLLLGLLIFLPIILGIILFAAAPSLTTLTLAALLCFLNLPWAVFWLDVREKYERLLREKTTKELKG